MWHLLLLTLGAAGLAHCGGAVSGGSDGGKCVDIDPSSYDQSCQQDTDCIPIVSGSFCPNSSSCLCAGSVAINASQQVRYESELSSIHFVGGCNCPAVLGPRCLGGVCTVCAGVPSDPPACHSMAGYGPPQDCIAAGGQCVTGPSSACAKLGPGNTCNCNPGCTPSGSYCCLEFVDAGEAALNGSADSSDESESRPGEGGEPTCVPENGVYTCLGGSWPACMQAPQSGGLFSCPPGATACMDCSSGVGTLCPCGDNGGVPICVGTGHSCQ